MEKVLCEFKDKNPGSTGLSHLDIYELIEVVEMKDSVKGWITAIVYKSITSEKKYVREKEDFYEKFLLTELYNKTTLNQYFGITVNIDVRNGLSDYTVKHDGRVISEGHKFKTYNAANLNALLDATKYVESNKLRVRV